MLCNNGTHLCKSNSLNICETLRMCHSVTFHFTIVLMPLPIFDNFLSLFCHFIIIIISSAKLNVFLWVCVTDVASVSDLRVSCCTQETLLKLTLLFPMKVQKLVIELQCQSLLGLSHFALSRSRQRRDFYIQRENRPQNFESKKQKPEFVTITSNLLDTKTRGP